MKISFIKSGIVKKLVLVLILALIVLVLPNFYRGTLIDNDSYYNLRITQNFLNGNFHDNLGYGGRTILIQPLLPLTLIALNFILRLSFFNLIRFVGVVFGLLAIIICYNILKEMKLKNRILLLIIFVLSPPFIYLFSNLNRYTIPAFLSLLALLLFLKQRMKLTSFILLLIPFYDFGVGLLVFFLFFVLVKSKYKEYTKWLLWNFGIVILLVLIYYSFLIRSLPEFIKFRVTDIDINFAFQNFISDFGGKIGLSFFVILSSFIGLFSLWKKKFDYFLVIGLVLLLLLLAIYFNFILIYLNFILIIFAVQGLLILINTKWESRLIRDLTIFILITGIFMSGISHVHLLSNIGVNSGEIMALEFLNNQDDGVVFSHYSNGHLITEISGMKNVMDNNFVFAPNINERYKDSNILLNARKKEEAFEVINKYNILYIYINEKMKKSVWETDEDGLLFLLNTNKFDFEQIYSEDNIGIWRVRK